MSQEQADDIAANVGVTVERHRGQLRMAERLGEQYRNRLLHVYGLGWLYWDGARWAADNGDAIAKQCVIGVLKSSLGDAAQLTFGSSESKNLFADVRNCESAAGVRGVLSLAEALPEFACSVGKLDADPYLFNTPSGTLDLHAQQLVPHDPAHRITKVSGAAPDAAAEGTEFERFLGEVLPDREVRSFAQRLFGMSLLGMVKEHALPVFTGVGANGKSTLVDVVLKCFGDYGITVEPELLMRREGMHGTFLMDLMGTRLAVISETGEGKPLDATVAKRLSGGDRIRANRMRRDPVEFVPSHQMIMVTNHKPKVAGDDPALWRRLHVVPFDVVVSKIDPHLPERLEQELPAVLTWVMQGYTAYVQYGLAAPAAVTERTATYQASSDALARFLGERTQSNPNDAAPARELYAAWVSWCQECKEEYGSEVVFAESMERRGYAKKTRGGRRLYVGVMLLGQEGASR